MYNLLLHKTPVHIILPRRHSSLRYSRLRNSRTRSVGVSLLNCLQMDGGGLDSDGREFKNAEEMWREEVGDGDPLKKSQWYTQGVGYWQRVDATVDGVLGGYGHVNKPDIEASEAFLNSVLVERFPDAAARGRHLVALGMCETPGTQFLTKYMNQILTLIRDLTSEERG